MEMEDEVREIKFRAWDKKKKEWLKNAYGFHLLDILTNDSWFLFRKFPEDRGTIKVEQYIGQKDINGQAIYEGDIVRTDELGWVGRVIFNYTSFMLMDNKGRFSRPTWKRCMLMGNIHEHPDLMKGKIEDE